MTQVHDGPLLPASFADLEKWAPDWCLGSEEERFHRRVSADMDSLEALNSQAFRRMPAIIDYLNGLGIDEPERLSLPDKRLFDLANTIMECSIPIDLEWGRNDIEDAFPPARLGFQGPSKAVRP